MPGGLQDMVVFGIEAGGNPRTLSLVHATRSLVLVTIAPIVLTQIFELELDNPLGSPITELPLIENIGLFLIGIVGMVLFRKLKLFGADILGPLLLSAPLAMVGILTHRPSEEMIILSQFFIGIGVGIHYQGITTKELSRDIIAGLGFVAVVIAIALITLLGASQISDIPLFELFLCFWPGGQAEIAVMTLAAGGSVSIIVLHHIVRIFLVITGAPILHKLKKKRESSNPTI
jgi:membrane AbrB-like protein